ncbi:protein lethal(2)essential for life-like [Prorops nasuta]|uniref:protein lethal(2)essential for life-like n=1 Tax=Prorops nasuta TaxID=863751 RepID=UPI0034CD8C24
MVSPLLPALLFSAWLADLDQPHRLNDQNFGVGLHQDQLVFPSILERYYPPGFSDLYYRPWAELMRKNGGGTSTISMDKDIFKVILDVQQFKPEEVSVKVVDRVLVVEGKHEEKKDEHGTVSRQFVRKYILPDQVDVDKVTSSISSDGILTITAPLKEVPPENVRTIAIERTGKPAIRDDSKQKGKDKIENNQVDEEVTVETEETTPTTPIK